VIAREFLFGFILDVVLFVLPLAICCVVSPLRAVLWLRADLARLCERHRLYSGGLCGSAIRGVALGGHVSVAAAASNEEVAAVAAALRDDAALLYRRRLCTRAQRLALLDTERRLLAWQHALYACVDLLTAPMALLLFASVYRTRETWRSLQRVFAALNAQRAQSRTLYLTILCLEHEIGVGEDEAAAAAENNVVAAAAADAGAYIAIVVPRRERAREELEGEIAGTPRCVHVHVLRAFFALLVDLPFIAMGAVVLCAGVWRAPRLVRTVFLSPNATASERRQYTIRQFLLLFVDVPAAIATCIICLLFPYRVGRLVRAVAAVWRRRDDVLRVHRVILIELIEGVYDVPALLAALICCASLYRGVLLFKDLHRLHQAAAEAAAEAAAAAAAADDDDVDDDDIDDSDDRLVSRARWLCVRCCIKLLFADVPCLACFLLLAVTGYRLPSTVRSILSRRNNGNNNIGGFRAHFIVLRQTKQLILDLPFIGMGAIVTLTMWRAVWFWRELHSLSSSSSSGSSAEGNEENEEDEDEAPQEQGPRRVSATRRVSRAVLALCGGERDENNRARLVCMQHFLLLACDIPSVLFGVAALVLVWRAPLMLRDLGWTGIGAGLYPGRPGSLSKAGVRRHAHKVFHVQGHGWHFVACKHGALALLELPFSVMLLCSAWRMPSLWLDSCVARSEDARRRAAVRHTALVILDALAALCFVLVMLTLWRSRLLLRLLAAVKRQQQQKNQDADDDDSGGDWPWWHLSCETVAMHRVIIGQACLSVVDVPFAALFAIGALSVWRLPLMRFQLGWDPVLKPWAWCTTPVDRRVAAALAADADADTADEAKHGSARAVAAAAAAVVIDDNDATVEGKNANATATANDVNASSTYKCWQLGCVLEHAILTLFDPLLAVAYCVLMCSPRRRRFWRNVQYAYTTRHSAVRVYGHALVHTLKLAIGCCLLVFAPLLLWRALAYRAAYLRQRGNKCAQCRAFLAHAGRVWLDVLCAASLLLCCVLLQPWRAAFVLRDLRVGWRRGARNSWRAVLAQGCVTFHSVTAQHVLAFLKFGARDAASLICGALCLWRFRRTMQLLRLCSDCHVAANYIDDDAVEDAAALGVLARRLAVHKHADLVQHSWLCMLDIAVMLFAALVLSLLLLLLLL
jgi:hypothetical protein